MAKIYTLNGDHYNTSKPICEEFREQCDLGDFKLRDNTFVDICEGYNISEEDAMQLMVEYPKEKGEFVRVDGGWIFSNKD